MGGIRPHDQFNVDEKNLRRTRGRKEEYRQSVLAPPYGKLFWLLDDVTFQKHPYRRGVSEILNSQRGDSGGCREVL